jgi:phytoene synthase
MSDAFDHCERLVRTADRDHYIASLFAAERHRPALFALYAFNSEIARVRELAHEPMPGEIRLQWWRDILAGPPGGEAGPVAEALRDTIVRYRLPLTVFLDLIEARTFDLYDDPMGTLAELEGYAAKTSSAVMGLAAQILNDGGEAGVADLTGHAGIALAVARLLEAFPLHVRRRQLYVPLDLLQRHGTRPEDVFAGIASPTLNAALAALRAWARDHLREARGLIDPLSPAVAPAVLLAALARPILDRQERRDPFRLDPLPAWRRQWLLWRAARHPRRLAG